VNALLAEYQENTQHVIDAFPQASGDWLLNQRQTALKHFSQIGFPHPHLEAWRYTNVEGLLKQKFITPVDEFQFSQFDVRQQFIQQPVAARLVFVDGIYQADMSHCSHEGVSIDSLNTLMSLGDLKVLKAVGALSGLGEDGFAALNLASFRDGSVVRVKADVKLDSPIELLHLTTGHMAGCRLSTRHLILLEAGAKAELIERCQPLTEEVCSFNHLLYEVSLAEGSELNHQRVQQESRSTYHLSDLYVSIKKNASYRSVNASIGAAWSRTVLHCQLLEPGANCELDGFYLVGNGQLIDFHLDVDHRTPQSSSRENFKGILYGAGKAVFDGLIQVREQAQKSEAHLHNANLMLSRQAEVDAKPQLLILADDVACSHGTTVGQLDDQALFYMRSRGLSEQQAKRLLCHGFVADIVDRFECDALRIELHESVMSGF
jgi:Fe-S cluster assembly protein SufD